MIFDIKKFFLFLGEDLTKMSNESILSVFKNGYTFIPLDAPAVGLIQKSGLPFTLLEQLLGTELIIEAEKESFFIEREWFSSEQEHFTLNGTCWPAFDKEAMRWFWREIITAYKFVEIFRKRSYESVICFSNSVLRPALFYYRSDVHATILKALLGSKCTHFCISNSSHSMKKLLTSYLTFNDYLMDQYNYSSLNINDKIVFALNSGEFYRFIPVISQLKNYFPEEVSIVSISPHKKKILELSDNMSLPIVTPNVGINADMSISNQFIFGYNEIINRISRGIVKDTLEQLKYHFEYYCKYRWPILNNNLLSWRKLFSKCRPRAVIISRLCDAESQLPAQAANILGIPTFSLPHSGFFSQDSVIAKTDYVLYDSLPMLKVLKRSGVNTEKLKPCSQVISFNEYPCISYQKKKSKRSKWQLLIITYPVMSWGFHPSVSPLSQIRALKVLNSPPSDIAENVELTIKPHPGWPELEIFSIIDSKLEKQVCPQNSDLSDLIRKTDLVIVVNCHTAGAKNALSSKKPTIFFWTSPFYQKKVGPETSNAHLLSPGGTEVHTANELWNTVRKYFEDENFARFLHSKAKHFFNNNLDNSKYPNIGDVVNQVLSKKLPKTINCNVNQLIPSYESIPIKIFNDIIDQEKMPKKDLIPLCKIIQNKQPKTIFEFGTYQGSTTLHFSANSQANVYTFDLPPKGYEHFFKTERIEKEIDVHQKDPDLLFHGTPYAKNIQQIYGNSKFYDFSDFYNKVDIVFVNASHHFEYVLKDSLNALKMIKTDGIIIWHNYASYAPGVIKAIDELSTKFNLYHIQGTCLIFFFGQQPKIGHLQGNKKKHVLQNQTSIYNKGKHKNAL